ncbi:MAG: hypothetical protein LBQ92_03090 [Propionibacteriaceae bacterium]|jgi:hypothetical protein|nr:hypothetical protein [Propionibacteriaceae bacterium]
MQAYLLQLVERQAAASSNAGMFERTAALRVRIPDEYAPEELIRADRGPIPGA